MRAFIEIKNLTRQYPDAEKPAVDKLNLAIGRGEIFGLLGPNGAGKTTTLSMLCTLSKPDSGSVYIDGKNLLPDGESLKKIIGVVPQDIALYPRLTAYENLMFFGNMYGLKGRKLKDRIEECAVNYGLTHKLHSKISIYSGGMKRRVNLIAGLLHKPAVLFLDEPTVGIDVQSKLVIIGHLKNLNTTENTTIIYTSHMMEEAESFCTDIAIIDQGKIIATGKPEQMIQQYDGCNNLEDIFISLTGRKLRD